MWQLFWGPNLPSYQNMPQRKRGNLPCLDLTSLELFQICLHYVCNLYFHIKFSAIFSSCLGGNKTHICGCICITGCSSALAFLMPGCVPEWVTTSCWAEAQTQFTLLCTWFSWKENHSTHQYLPRLNEHRARTHSMHALTLGLFLNFIT